MRILIVEDEKDELSEIATHIKGEFKAAEILTAGGSSEARQVLKQCSRQNKKLNIAILDIRMKDRKYETLLPYQVREQFPDSLILHYTMFTKAKSVREHAKVRFRAHDQIIQKGPGGIENVCETIRQYWEYKLIEEVKQNFELPATTSKMRERGHLKQGLTRCDTLQINTLVHEISEFYEKFSDCAMKEIKKYFVFRRERNKWRGRPQQ